MNVNTSLINPQLIRGSILIVLIYIYIYTFFFTLLRGNHWCLGDSVRPFGPDTWYIQFVSTTLVFYKIGCPKNHWFHGFRIEKWRILDDFWCFWNHRHRCGVLSETMYRWGCTSWNWRFFRFFLLSKALNMTPAKRWSFGQMTQEIPEIPYGLGGGASDRVAPSERHQVALYLEEVLPSCRQGFFSIARHKEREEQSRLRGETLQQGLY